MIPRGNVKQRKNKKSRKKRQERTTVRGDECEKKKKVKPHKKDARKDTEITRQKRELSLEAVRGAGSHSSPLIKKTLL